ncbi:MAG: polysaccharide biosynthesis C-terminal domain-containing protein, partial [Lachnospiraceae bacterium]|nr:polysaccharide biosynthesis C-terminal domain-containing protein [Lachnospiraceae bacterium]
VSMLAAYLLIGLVADEGETTRAIYGASGSALGTGAGVLIALLFMFGMYRLNKDVIRRRVERDHTPHQESYGDIFKVIISTVTPFILSTFIYNCSTVVNMKIYQSIMKDIEGLDEALIAIQYGIFATQAITIVNIPIAISSAMSSASIPGISATFSTHKENETRHKVSQAIRMTMLIAIPSAVGLFVLSKPIVQFIYPQKEALDTASELVRVLGITVILYGLSTLTNAVLQGIGKVNIPVIHAVVALAAQVGLLVALLLYTDLNLYALAIANIVYSLIMCILNHSAVKRYLKYREEVMKTYVKPGIAAVCMGVVAFGIYHSIYYFIQISRIALLPAIAIAAAVYFILIIKLGAVNESELKAFPKGHMMVAVAKKMHLLK